jgi:hypothetical protein
MNNCETVVIKSECTETVDIIQMHPIEGRVRMFEQGKGMKTALVSVAGDLKASACKIYGKECSGTAKIGTTETVYSGTPYKISTIRCVG